MRIFVSYNNRDLSTAERVVQGLGTAQPGLAAYFAPRSNVGGAYWVPRLGDELKRSDVFLLLLGARVGPWQELEYYEALRLNRARGTPRIVPVLLGEESPGLWFLSQFHRLRVDHQGFEALIAQLGAAVQGAGAAGDRVALPWRETNPYRGLRAMSSADAAWFFGREELTGEIIQALRARSDRVLVLIGNSGVGKSSIVEAGVLAALRSQLWPGDLDRRWPSDLRDSRSWLAVNIRPGERPLKALALGFVRTWLDDPAAAEAQALRWVGNFGSGSDLAALTEAARNAIAQRAAAEPPTRILLYIDQGEELYARSEAGEADRFSELVAGAVGRDGIAVMTSLRSDYYGSLQEDAALFAASKRIDVPPLGLQEIQAVLQRPADRLGARFDTPELVPLIAEATARESGALPLLSFMMSETWEAMRRDQDSEGVLHFPLGVADLAGPLLRRAETFIETHHGTEATLRQLLTLRLAHVPKEGEPVRRRATRAECSPAEWSLAEELAAAEWRLLTTGREGGAATVEVAHEILLRKWPRLTAWIDQEREFLIWKGQLETDRREWEAAPLEKRDAAVLMGLALETARRWLLERGGDLPGSDAAFVRRSDEVEQTRSADEAQRSRELTIERERSRRRAIWFSRASTAAAIAFLLIGIGAAWLFFRERDARDAAVAALSREAAAAEEAERQALRAEAEADLAVALNLAALADRTLEENTGETAAAAMIALDSLRLTRTDAALRVLRSVLSYKPAGDPSTNAPWRSSATFSKDGRIAAWTRRDANGAGDEKMGVETRVAILSPADFSEIASGMVPGGAEPALSGDGKTWVAAGATRALHIGTTDHWQPRATGSGIGDVVALFQGEGKTLVVAHEDGHIELRHGPDWDTDRELRFRPGGITSTLEAALADDVLVVLENGFPASALTFVPLNGSDPIAGRMPHDPLAPSNLNGRAWGLAAAAGRAITSHDDGTIRLWDVVDGTLVEELTIAGTRGFPARPAISGLGTIAAAGSRATGSDGDDTKYESIIALWKSDGATSLPGWTYPALAREIAFSPDGIWLAIGGENGLDLRKVAEGPVHRLLEGEQITALSFEADGALLVGTQAGGLLRVDPVSATIKKGKALTSPVKHIAADGSGHRLVVAFGDGRDASNWSDVIIVDPATNRRLAAWSWNGPLAEPHLSPDGQLFAARDWGSREVLIWSTQSGRLLERVPIEGSFDGFSPSGEGLLVDDYKLRLHDRRTGLALAEIGEPGGVYEVLWPQEGSVAVVEDFDDRTVAWDLVTGQRGPALGHADWRSPDGKVALIFDADAGALRVVVSDNAEEIGRIDGDRPATAAVSNDGRSALLVYERDGMARSDKLVVRDVVLADVGSGKTLWSDRVEIAKGYTLVLPEAHAGGGFSVTGMGLSEDNYARFWLLYFPPEQHKPWKVQHPEGWRIEHAVSDRTGRFVALASSGGLELRNARTGAVIWNDERPSPDDHVEALTFLPDGDRLVTFKGVGSAPDTTEIRVRESASGRTLQKWGVDGRVGPFDVSKDGKCIVAGLDGDERGELLVFDVASGLAIDRVPLTTPPQEVRYLSDPRLVAVWDWNSTVEVWDIAAKKMLHRVSPSVTADGYAHATNTMRAVTTKGRSIQLWDTEQLKETASLIAQGDAYPVAISPTGETVAFFSESEDLGSSVGIWSPGAETMLRNLPAEEVSDIVFSPVGTQVAIRSRERPPGENASVERTVRVIALDRLSPLLSVRALPFGELTWTGFSADGSYLLNVESAHFQGRGVDIRPMMLRVFDIVTEAEVARRSLGASDIAVVPGTSAVLYQDTHGRERRLDLPGDQLDAVRTANGGLLQTVTGSTRALLESYWGPTQTVDAASDGAVINLSKRDGPYNVIAADLSADGRQALLSLRESDWSIESKGRAELRDPSTGELLHPPLDWPHFFNGAWIARDGIAFLSRLEGNYVREGESEFELVWWNAPTGETRVLTSDNPVTHATVSGDGTLFAAALGAQTEDSKAIGTAEISVWNVATGEHEFSLPTDLKYPRLAISDDNRYLAAAANADQVVFDLATHEVVYSAGRRASYTVSTGRDYATDSHQRVFNGYRPRFIPDSDTLVLVTNQSIVMHDLADGTTERLSESANISGSSISADGRYAALIAGASVSVWDLDARTRVVSIPLAGVTQLAFAGEDGSTLLALGEDGVFRVTWNPEDLVKRACVAYGTEDWAKSRYRLTGADDPGPC